MRGAGRSQSHRPPLASHSDRPAAPQSPLLLQITANFFTYPASSWTPAYTPAEAS